MPKMDKATAALFMSRFGAEQLIGNTVWQVNPNQRVDTHAADGEIWVVYNGEEFILSVYSAETQTWPQVVLS